MIDAALFDWDGTLLDSRSALLGAWHAATQEILARRWPTNAQEEELVFTLPGSQLFPRVAGDAGAAERLRDGFQRAYETTGEQVRAFPGVADMLAELRGAGLRIGVITSKARQRYDLDARRIGLAERIDLAVCQEDTRAHKPDPASATRWRRSAWRPIAPSSRATRRSTWRPGRAPARRSSASPGVPRERGRCSTRAPPSSPATPAS
jgi:phosphoglycolate phosphatase-like HAD superfamily hydrolase